MTELFIYGAGSLGKAVISIIEDINDNVLPEWKISGFLDDDTKRHGDYFRGYKIQGDSKFLKGRGKVAVVIAVSNYVDRENIYRKLGTISSEIKFPHIIHPTAWVPESVKLGIGCIIFPGVGVDPDVHIGRFGVFNKNVTVGDSSRIGDYVNLSAGVNVGSFNTVGDYSSWGRGSNSVRALNIGVKTIIGAGTLLVENASEEAAIFGNPGKELEVDEFVKKSF